MTSKSISFETRYNIPKPFLKWAGGKTQLLDQFTRLYPREFNAYHEPFVGSGAVYFHLRSLKMNGTLNGSMTRAYLTDCNDELVNCYRVVQNGVDELILLLTKHKRKHSPDYYYKVRSQDPTRLNEVKRAARLIYLNKTCFNGLYRVNRDGQFNVPMGRYKNPAIFDEEKMRVVSQSLQTAHINYSSFKEVLNKATSGDFVYFDPPYHPLSKTSNFTSYTENNFGEQEQRELADAFRELDRKGCRLMLSNSSVAFVWKLYEGFRRERVKATRLINSKAHKRGKISELVILNY
ncbi:MAG: DNA adenine methylase [Chloroflexi bacterium]|nr:DNA adenine methylase [Chloroflexota bacterium]